MKTSTRGSIHACAHLLLFSLYIAALWGVTWYNLRYYGGVYNTIITDLLLTAAFALVFFPSLLRPRHKKNTAVALTAALLCAGAVLALFALQPRYTVADGCRILANAHYQDVHLAQQTVSVPAAQRRHFPVSAQIVLEGEQNAQLHEILFDLGSGTYDAIT